MSNELVGKIQQIMEPVSGTSKAGNQWSKREFVIETDGQYPKKVCFTCWGDRIDDLSNYQKGEEITVSFDVESREYNGRWYTDLKAWRLDKGDKGKETEGAPPPAATTATPPNLESNTGSDDLPF